ncbi:hypothetical protein B0H14DRAFT_2629875 [Mycena olivaceomarginata]|nr:hypothetical protein B0H14DRAFT_2629875 [Mycena olivaceomarginata]
MILFSRRKISVGMRGIVCDLADTILKPTWFACDPSYIAAHYCETDLSLITAICVCVLHSDFKLRPRRYADVLPGCCGNIASMFTRHWHRMRRAAPRPTSISFLLFPRAACIARTDILESGLFIITTLLSNASSTRLQVDHRVRDSGCVPAAPVEFPSIVLASGAAVNIITPMTPYPTPNQSLMTILGLGKCETSQLAEIATPSYRCVVLGSIVSSVHHLRSSADLSDFWFFKFVGVSMLPYVPGTCLGPCNRKL